MEKRGHLRGLQLLVSFDNSLRLQPTQKPTSPFGVSGGGEDCALVVLQNLQPFADIAGVIGARLWRQAAIGR